MNRIEVDVAVLGAGTAGLNARRAAEKAGARAVMIDPGPYGTTCARVGCMPSKLLIAAAEAAHGVHAAATFGVRVEGASVDGRAVMARVRSERDRFTGFVVRDIDEHAAKGRLVKGRGRFVDANTIQVDDHTEVVFRSAVIATGSSPWVPPPFRDLGDKLVDNEGVFDWTDLPKSALVVGTGVIGLELGQALHRLGVRTSLVGIDGFVGPLSDPKVKEVAHAVFCEELDFRNDYSFESVGIDDDGMVVLRADGREDRYEVVVGAAGRKPNLAGLGLQDAFGWDARALPQVDPRTGQIGDSHVFIAGDVSNYRPLLHEASHEGRIAGRNAALFPQLEAEPRRTPLAVVFSDPQIGIVGQGHGDLCATRGGYCAGEVDYSRQGRARVMAKNRGLVRIYGACADGELLGAEMFGPGVEHTAHLLAWAIQQKLSVHELLQMPFYHPVLEEGIRSALQDLRHNLHLPATPTGCEELKDSA